MGNSAFNSGSPLIVSYNLMLAFDGWMMGLTWCKIFSPTRPLIHAYSCTIQFSRAANSTFSSESESTFFFLEFRILSPARFISSINQVARFCLQNMYCSVIQGYILRHSFLETVVSILFHRAPVILKSFLVPKTGVRYFWTRNRQTLYKLATPSSQLCNFLIQKS